MKKLQQKSNKGKLYLIPTILAEETQEATLPYSISETIRDTSIFIVENIRTARRHIKKIDPKKDINTTTFYCYGKYSSLNLEKDFLSHILSGQDVGLLSEAGLPCIADPGAEIVAYAHDFKINVVPLVGPSAIFLALTASGLNGQSFAFNGYLPIKKPERNNRIKQLETIIRKTGQTQIFMEAPYRNNQLMEALLKTCNNNIKLCIASDITQVSEDIKSKTISEWKQIKIDINKKPTIFLLG